MVTYTTTILAAANLLALAHAAPAQPVCKVVTEVVTGRPFWKPTPDAATGGWGSWADPKSTAKPTWTTWADPDSTSKATWSSWVDPKDPKKTTTTTTSSLFWGEWPSGVPKPGETTKSEDGHDHPHPTTSETKTLPYYTTTSVTSTLPYYTTPATTEYHTPTTTTTTTTTTQSPAPTTCPASGNPLLNLAPAGSCGCSFTTHCNQLAYPGSDAQFWQRTGGELIETLEECLEICNNNDKCQAAVWSNQEGEPDSDYKKCYQVINLPQPATTGYGQLSYKGSCSGKCSQSYTSTG